MTYSDTTTPTMESSDDIDLLDLLVILADNLKFLVIATIVTTLLGLGIAYLLPPTFESTSVYSSTNRHVEISPDVIASYLRSPDARIKAGHDLGLDAELSNTRLLKKMDKLITVSVGRQDKLITLTTYGKTPEAAQKLNQLLWQYALPYTVPRGMEAQRLENQLTAEKERLASSLALEKRTAEALQQGTPSENEILLYGELLKSNSQRLETISALEARLSGLTDANFTQHPSLVEDPIKPKKLLIAIACGLGGGFIALLWVFASAALRSASQNPAQADKVRRIRAALGLKA